MKVADFNESLSLFQSMMVKNSQKYVPNSISILINFGFSNQHLYYNAAEEAQICAAYQLWDPFSQVCRDIYCHSNFELAGLTCISWPSGGEDDKLEGNFGPENFFLTFVHLLGTFAHFCPLFPTFAHF